MARKSATSSSSAAGGGRPKWVLPSHYGVTGAVATTDLAKISVKGYARSVRPLPSYTDALKKKQMAQWGLAGGAAAYEEDHLVPLELGGHPRNPKNLWPQPRAGGQAASKDMLENYLHKLVVAKTLGLAATQKAIEKDWIALWMKYSTAAKKLAKTQPWSISRPPTQRAIKAGRI